MPKERDLFADFERMRRQIDELFGDVFERSGLAPQSEFAPAVDVYYCGEPPHSVVVKAALPGIDPDRLSIEIHGRRLEISGERAWSEPKGRIYQQIEIEQGPFRRSVELGMDVQADEASAAYENGILRVEVPLARPEERVRRVPIRRQESGK